jgi:hypothetical protein
VGGTPPPKPLISAGWLQKGDNPENICKIRCFEMEN